MSDEFAPFIKQLEQLGEDQVRSKLSMGQWADRRKKWAQDWLEHRNSDRRDAREEETLSIAREALSNSERANAIADSALLSSERANKIAISAIIFASALAIVAAVIQVMF